MEPPKNGNVLILPDPDLLLRSAPERPLRGEEIIRLQKSIKTAKKIFVTWGFIAFALVGVAVVLGANGYGVYAALSGTYAVGAALAALVNRIRSNFAEQDLRRLELEDDIFRYDVPSSEAWALKLMGVQEDRLRRYYELNIGQSLWTFLVGILSLVGGFGLVIYTLTYIKSLQSPDKLVGALLGGLTALSAQVIAALYLRLNVSTAANLQTLHGRLVDTYNLLLANMLATRVQPNDQSKVWAAMSLAIVRLQRQPTNAIGDSGLLQASDGAAPAANAEIDLQGAGDEMLSKAPNQPPG